MVIDIDNVGISGIVSLLGRLLKYEVKRTFRGIYDVNRAEYEIKVEDIATGISAKATHRNNRSAALKDALKNVVEQLNERGYLRGLDLEMLATAFANCVEEPSTCVQEGVVASDPSAFLTASTRPTSTFQPSPPLLPWNNLLENLNSYILNAALGIGIFIFILFIISCWYRYKRRKAFLHGLQPEKIIEPQFNHHTLTGEIYFLGDPWRETVTSAGKEIFWTDIGIKINIPPGAIPEGEPITVAVRPCLSGRFELPEDYELASPVYAISPGLEFSKDVKLFMAHFVDLRSEDDCKNMTFLTTQSSSLPESSHLYRLLVQENGVFHRGSREGGISLRHFCKKAIGKKRKQDGKQEQKNAKRSKTNKQKPKLGSKEQQRSAEKSKDTVTSKPQNLYLVQLYQNTGDYLYDNVAAVTVSLHHPLYAMNFKKCLEEWYPPPYRFLPSGKAVHFSRRKATIEVPNDIVEGWKIVPDIQPCEIPREEVDLPILTPALDYTIACTYPPKILLTISPPPAEVGLSHSSHCKLQISGFAEKVQFTLRLRPPPHVQVMMAPVSQVNFRGLLPSQPDSETEHSSMANYLQPTMQDLIAFPAIDGILNIPQRISTKYKQFGVVLLEDDEGALVDGIAHKNFNNPEEINIDILTQWLRGKGRKPVTWKTMINTLEEIGLKTIAKDIGLALVSQKNGRDTV